MTRTEKEPNSQETAIKKEHISEPTVSLLLVDLGSPHNIGNIIRTCWVLGGESVRLFIYDPRSKLGNNRDDIDLSSVTLVGKDGAYTEVEDLEEFLSSYPGRIVATDVTQKATVLRSFQFQPGDLIMFGNENRGYKGKDLTEYRGMEYIDERLIVPMLGEKYDLPDRGKVVPKEHGKYPNLNVAVTASIVLHAALDQLGCFNEFDLEDFK